jgi:Large polyvalent protein-associated domain 7
VNGLDEVPHAKEMTMAADAKPDNCSDFHYLEGGGVVEPADFALALSKQPPRPYEWRGELFEIVDPSGEIKARAGTPYQIKREAARLGVDRYTEVGLDRLRRLYEKVDGSWQPSTKRAPMPVMPPRPPRSPLTPLEVGLAQRYVIGPAEVSMDEITGQTAYRFRSDPSRVAFTALEFRVYTDINSPSAARSMVDLAESKQWGQLRVKGHIDFKRMVWLETSLRGLEMLGYEPTRSDVEMLRSERRERLIDSGGAHLRSQVHVPDRAKTSSARGPGARKAVLAAIEAVLVARNVPDPQRKAVVDAATQKLALRSRTGLEPRVKVYDRAAPSRQPAIVTRSDAQPTREQVAPVR